MVDTIGMEIFETSDVQYHFKGELEVSEIITMPTILQCINFHTVIQSYLGIQYKA